MNEIIDCPHVFTTILCWTPHALIIMHFPDLDISTLKLI